jgi:hypothetical protein
VGTGRRDADVAGDDAGEEPTADEEERVEECGEVEDVMSEEVPLRDTDRSAKPRLVSA